MRNEELGIRNWRCAARNFEIARRAFLTFLTPNFSFLIHYCQRGEVYQMRLLLIEDDEALCEALRPALAGFGALEVCHTGTEGLALLLSGGYDLCILDRMLPGLDGVTLLRAARAKGLATPVLMLTALAGPGDMVDGLDAGADDYLPKPFDTAVLQARLRALLRRSGGVAALSAGDLRLDRAELTLTGPAGTAVLSRKECDLLEALLRAPGKLQARPVLLARVWGPLAEVEDANLDCYIHFVRRRLAAVGSRARVVTVRGSGYKLEADPC